MADAFLGVRTSYGSKDVDAFIPVNASDVGDGFMAVIWHTVASGSPLTVFNKLTRLLEVVKEQGFPFPATVTDYMVMSLAGTDSKPKALIGESPPSYLFSPEEFAVVYSGTFINTRPGSTGLMMATGDALLNRTLEVLKF